MARILAKQQMSLFVNKIYLYLIEKKEAAIGIEPMNKGFAVHSSDVSLSITERYPVAE